MMHKLFLSLVVVLSGTTILNTEKCIKYFDKKYKKKEEFSDFIEVVPDNTDKPLTNDGVSETVETSSNSKVFDFSQKAQQPETKIPNFVIPTETSEETNNK